ncbi:MAG TPA: 50S ribosomal protein L3 [Patescibacteria group bacterium]|nr:50S ribosomal protein L3 [Patescibacteria group bacterium]
MKFIIGKKMAMTQVWNSDDKVIAVTPVQAGPCTVVQIKNKDKDGYEAMQLAYGKRKEKNINKPQKGHFKAVGVSPMHVREFRTTETNGFKPGDVISVETFTEGETINVTGTSKGKGFQGVIKRHGFHGFRATHGNKDQERMPGSIGSKGPARVFKGKKMGGRMGDSRVTVTNLKIQKVDIENNVIYIAGAIPGAINGLILINAKGELQVNLQKKVEEKVKEEKNEKVEEVVETPVVETPVVETPKEETKVEEKVKEEKIEEKVEEKVKEEKVEEKKVEVKEEKKEVKKEEESEKSVS